MTGDNNVVYLLLPWPLPEEPESTIEAADSVDLEELVAMPATAHELARANRHTSSTARPWRS